MADHSIAYRAATVRERVATDEDIGWQDRQSTRSLTLAALYGPTASLRIMFMNNPS